MRLSAVHKFDTQLSLNGNRPGSLIFIIFFTLAWVVDISTGVLDRVPLELLAAAFIFVSILWILQYKGFLVLGKSPAYLLVLYHLVLAVALLRILPFGLGYAYLGLILVLMSSYAYGSYGAVLSTLVITSFIIMSFMLKDSPTEQHFAELIRMVSLFFILAANYYFTVDIATRELGELKSSDVQLRAEHQRMKALINSMGDGVISTDRDSKIVSYNGAALEILDTNVTMTGRPLSDFLKTTDEDGKPVDLVENSMSKNKNVQRRDIVHTYQDGERINIFANTSPVKMGFGADSQKGFTIIIRDITKEKSLEEERDEFISVVSHELRTPITVTEGKISNAMLHNDRETKNKKIANALKEAHDQVIFLAAMINDLATLARAERASLDFTPEEIDPKQLVKDLAAAYEIEAKQNGLSIKSTSSGKIPKLSTSELYLKEVLQNFITNSIKYTKKGSITISVSAKGKNVIFAVKDTGIGISKSDQKRLFDKFFRSEDYRTRESSGTGLGLYVTAKLVQKIQAKLDVTSTMNKGSTFTITVHSLSPKKSRHHQESS